MRTKTLANLLLQSVLLQPLQADLVIRQANNTAPQCNLSQTVSSKVCQKTNDLIKKYEIKRSNQEGAPYNASSAEIAKIFQKLELDKMEISDFLTASSTDLAKRLTFLTKTTKRVEPPKKTQEANLFKPFNPHEITTALKSKNFSYTEYENCINYKPISTGPDLVAEVIQEESFTWSTLEHKNTRKDFLTHWLKANGTQYFAFNEAPLITFLNYSCTTTDLLQEVLNLLSTLLKSDFSLENQQKFASSISQITPHLSSLEALDLQNFQEKCEEFLNYTTSNKYISLAFDTINNLSDKNIQKHYLRQAQNFIRRRAAADEWDKLILSLKLKSNKKGLSLKGCAVTKKTTAIGPHQISEIDFSADSSNFHINPAMLADPNVSLMNDKDLALDDETLNESYREAVDHLVQMFNELVDADHITHAMRYEYSEADEQEVLRLLDIKNIFSGYSYVEKQEAEQAYNEKDHRLKEMVNYIQEFFKDGHFELRQAYVPPECELKPNERYKWISPTYEQKRAFFWSDDYKDRREKLFKYRFGLNSLFRGIGDAESLRDLLQSQIGEKNWEKLFKRDATQKRKIDSIPTDFKKAVITVANWLHTQDEDIKAQKLASWSSAGFHCGVRARQEFTELQKHIRREQGNSGLQAKIAKALQQERENILREVIQPDYKKYKAKGSAHELDHNIAFLNRRLADIWGLDSTERNAEIDQLYVVLDRYKDPSSSDYLTDEKLLEMLTKKYTVERMTRVANDILKEMSFDELYKALNQTFLAKGTEHPVFRTRSAGLETLMDETSLELTQTAPYIILASLGYLTSDSEPKFHGTSEEEFFASE